MHECSDILYRRRNVIEILRLNIQLRSLVLFDSEIMDEVFIQSISEHIKHTTNKNVPSIITKP